MYKVWAIVAVVAVVLLGLLYLAEPTSAVTTISNSNLSSLFDPCNKLVTTYFKALTIEHWFLEKGIGVSPIFYYHLSALELDLIKYSCIYTV